MKGTLFAQVICYHHLYCVSSPFEQVIFQPSHNCLSYSHFFLITSFLTFSSLEVLAALLQNPISILKIFFLELVIHSPNFPTVTEEYFQSLYKLFFSLYSPKYIYSRVCYYVLLLLSWLAKLRLTILPCTFQSS